jgi:hypothetical protein
MRTLIVALWLIWLGLPASVRGGDRDKALEVIEQAIKAHGGAEALEKAQMCSRSGKGVIVSPGGEERLTTEETVRLPDSCRVVLEFGRNRVTLVLKGDKGWMQSGGVTQELNKEALRERRDDLYAWWLMSLTPLRKEEFTLTPLADARVDRQDAAVIKVTRRGYPDVRLFFDKKSGLLLKSARRATESGFTFTKEHIYSDYKDHEGAKLPGKEVVTSNGSKLAEVSFSDYTLLRRIDDKTFEKP